MYQIGKETVSLAELWKQMPKQKNEKLTLAKVDASSLLPSNKNYCRLSGSLTTPPYSEEVWRAV